MPTTSIPITTSSPGAKRVESEHETEQFSARWTWPGKTSWCNKFNNEDVIAREAMERFYAEEDGWNREHLFRPDMIITEWRKLASKHNRGIQRRPAVRTQDLTLRQEATP